MNKQKAVGADVLIAVSWNCLEALPEPQVMVPSPLPQRQPQTQSEGGGSLVEKDSWLTCILSGFGPGW